jgi:uncharacterized protein YhjY with autotransporter beta-barrel domain
LSLFFSSHAQATSCAPTFSTPENSPTFTYTLNASDLAACDPGGNIGIYDDTVCDTGTIATSQGGTALMDGGSPDTIQYTPKTGFSGTDIVTFFNSPNGVVCSPQHATVTVTPSGPGVSGVLPTSGPTTGGTSVALTGTNFTGASGVKFGATNATSFVVHSNTSITAIAPVGSAGTVDITVINGGVTSAVSSADHFTYIAAPVAGPVSATVGYGSANNPITLNLSGGAATSVAINTAPTHGTAAASGTSITYSPVASYAGPDSFTYTATNTVTVTVAAPTLTLSAASLPNAHVGSAYSQSITAAGGTAPYTYSISVGSLPAGLTLNSSSGLISGTPTAGGTASFTLRATDSSTGTGAPFSVTQAFSFTVAAPTLAAPIAGAKNVTAAYNTATTISLSSVLTGGAAVSLTVVSGPQHGSTTTHGLSVTYTPIAGYSGNDSFTYSATKTVGTSAAATVSIAVAPPPPPVANAVSATVSGQQGSPITLNITGGTPTSVAVRSAPRHGRVAINGIGITYTPNSGYIGVDNFTYTATNAGGSSAPATVSITVTAPPPTPGSTSAIATAGVPVVLAIASQAGGGPFTGLTIVTPPANGTATVQGLNIIYTAAPNFTGSVSIRYALTNAYGSADGIATVVVSARLDPSNDPEVAGLLAAQADATRRFATAQIANFGHRLESLHGDGWGTSSFGMGLSPTSASANPNATFNQAVAPTVRTTARDWQEANPQDQSVKSQANATSGGGAGDGQSNDGSTTKPDEVKHEISFWVDGGVNYGQRNPTVAQSRYSFNTDGISGGADYRVGDMLSIGLGGGFSRDVSENLSTSTGQSGVLATYATLRPDPRFFIDGVLGYSILHFDLNRFVTDAGGYASGHRDGSDVFASLAGGYEYHNDSWMLSPYGRIEIMSATLDPYTEMASEASALSYEQQGVRMLTGNVGLRAEKDYDLGFAKLVPNARVEYQRHFEKADDETLGYADQTTSGPGYTVTTAPAQRTQELVEVGGKLIRSHRISLSLDYGRTFGNDSEHSQWVRAGLNGKF